MDGDIDFDCNHDNCAYPILLTDLMQRFDNSLLNRIERKRNENIGHIYEHVWTMFSLDSCLFSIMSLSGPALFIGENLKLCS